jgi:hypothetical protein
MDGSPEAGNYFYMQSTGGTDLQKHLYRRHPNEYDEACTTYHWPNRRLQSVGEAPTQTHGAHGNLPPFSNKTFMNHLVRFIVADDQVCLFDHSLRIPRSTSLIFVSDSRFVSLNVLNFGNYA